MSARVQFTMSAAQLERLMDASKPTPAMWIGGPPSTPQENANRAWQQLADELGFAWDTVVPVAGAGPETFAAVPRTGSPT